MKIEVDLDSCDHMVELLIKGAIKRGELKEQLAMALENWAAEKIGVGRYVGYHHTSGFNTLDVRLDEARESIEETLRNMEHVGKLMLLEYQKAETRCPFCGIKPYQTGSDGKCLNCHDVW